MTNNILQFMRPFQSAEFMKTTTSVSLFPFDVSTMMDTHRKNFQALAHAQQLAMESMQVIAQRHAAMLSDIVSDQSNLTHELLESGKPEDKVADQSLILRHVYERTVTHLREISDMMAQSSHETADVIHKRVAHSLSELKDAIDKAKARRASA